MEDTFSTMITTRNTNDKRISTYSLCIAMLALISFINFILLIFVSLPAQIHDVLTPLDILIALIFLGDFFFRLLRVSNKWQYLRTSGWLDLLSGIPYPIFNIARLSRLLRLLLVL